MQISCKQPWPFHGRMEGALETLALPTVPSALILLTAISTPVTNPVSTTTNITTHPSPNLGQSIANDVIPYMNMTCPRILYSTVFGPRTGWNLFIYLLVRTSFWHWHRTTVVSKEIVPNSPQEYRLCQFVVSQKCTSSTHETRN
jgi:hypothetical protein